MKTLALIFVAFCCIGICAYTVPDPDIQLLSPRGIRVSIPDATGIQLVAFNGNVNKNIIPDQSGSISREIFRPTSSKWMFEDTHTLVQRRDVLHYWIYIQVDGSPHKKTGSWSPSATSPSGSCTPSITTTTRQGLICQGQLILEDNFDSFNTSIWSREIFIPSQPQYEFCVYHNHQQSVRIKNGTLHVIPSLLEDSYGERATAVGTMTLAECTSQVPSDCSRSATGYLILPPVISARLTTINHFNFQYGRVEIRAKFPEGDWLYPELWLQPKNPTQFSEFKSVFVRLGMARGNQVLTGTTGNYDGRLLEFGLRAGSAPNFQSVDIQKFSNITGHWTSGFHVYSTTWNADGFVFHVDGEEAGRLTPRPNDWFSNSNASSGTRNKMSPFDGQFYITLGVGVGGVRDFPDNLRSGDGVGYEKPWKNVAAKALLRFWEAKNHWFPSWQDSNNPGKSHLQIDYVRVYAL
ncbi:beta-1,3-glucan-binding protein 1 isoform X1 [Neodiprion pinetum]|uniref:Beta-1,3-glucan-binding protein 1 isoform X1 n=1 Tax=Neodiprion lecontei TaxID=441921 RepID=A0A6J0BJ06_NEOLC|nr:beta-1,3-glucan-binding protein 1 isoform X1 [Neodiprion lecontei]XP_046478401.1 beta-1,3-glucan-binding protein 1-like isoform X1 [Neodiprion pinetum]